MKKSHFTLLEIILVLSILAILGGGAMAAYEFSLKKFRAEHGPGLGRTR